ncbi:MAG: prolyl oligopeptidase family serine peptidase [Candidatus Methanofastidiosia archaeon]|jgi:dienelactone hydrolase
MKKIAGITLVLMAMSLCITQNPVTNTVDPVNTSLHENTSQKEITQNTNTPFGIHTTPRLYQLFPKLHASWTFIGILWEDIEPEQDVYTFEKTDTIIQKAQENNINLIIKIRTGTLWATKDKTSEKTSSPPQNYEDYTEFVHTLVTRYKDYVHYWAVENEMNTPRFWDGTLDEYNQVLQIAYTTIKDADPSAKVLDSGLASMTYGVCIARELYESGNTEKALEFYNQYYTSRGLAVTDVQELERVVYSAESERIYTIMMDHFKNLYYDIYQLHYYEDYALVTSVIQFIRDNLPEEKPIFAVEMGYAYTDDTTYNVDTHAENTVKLMVELSAENVSVLIYLPLIDVNTDGTEIWRGLVSPEREKRPALFAYGITARILGQKEFTGKSQEDITQYEFGNVTVVWSDTETEIQLEKKAAVITIHGEKDITKSVSVGPSPLFIVESEEPEKSEKSKDALQKEIDESIEIVEFPSYDGEVVQGFLKKPEGAGPFPAVVLVHGGTSSQDSAVWMAQAIGSLFVDRGYVVLSVHYRAGPIGLQDVEDTLAAIKYVNTLEYVTDIGVYGGSHGGYIALMCAWRSDVKAVVEAAGFCDLAAMAQSKPELAQFVYGNPESPEEYQKYSPCGHIAEFTAPVFIIHGKKDSSVPVEQAYILEELLKEYNKSYRIYISETGEHGFYHKKTEESKAVWVQIFEFFDMYLKS